MNEMSKAYYVWNMPRKGTKGIQKIHTKDGHEFLPEEWEKICLEMITKADLRDLLEQIEEHVQKNCLWVKNDELRRYSIDCLLKGSYKHWDDFVYQERLKV